MQKSVYYPVRVQASRLGPGWALFVSQILKEQEAFSVLKPADRQGALKAPNRALYRALKPTENSAMGLNESEAEGKVLKEAEKH